MTCAPGDKARPTRAYFEYPTQARAVRRYSRMHSLQWVAGIGIGCFLLVFRVQFTRAVLDYGRKAYGPTYDKPAMRTFAQVLNDVVGLGFIIGGFSALFGGR